MTKTQETKVPFNLPAFLLAIRENSPKIGVSTTVLDAFVQTLDLSNRATNEQDTK